MQLNRAFPGTPRYFHVFVPRPITLFPLLRHMQFDGARFHRRFTSSGNCICASGGSFHFSAKATALQRPLYWNANVGVKKRNQISRVRQQSESSRLLYVKVHFQGNQTRECIVEFQEFPGKMKTIDFLMNSFTDAWIIHIYSF